MKLYLARHGQTDWNVEHRAQGRTDIALNDIGKKQAEQLRENIKDIKFDAVYASPLKRAAETAQIAIGDRNGIVYDDRLVERSFGDFEGKVLPSFVQPFSGIDIDDPELNEIPNGVETVKNMLERAETFIDDLKQKYNDEANILIVTHGSFSKAIHFYVRGFGGIASWRDFHLENGEIKEYEVR